MPDYPFSDISLQKVEPFCKIHVYTGKIRNNFLLDTQPIYMDGIWLIKKVKILKMSIVVT